VPPFSAGGKPSPSVVVIPEGNNWREDGKMKKDEKECRSLCRELLTEKRKLKTIMDSIADGVFTIDTEWRITTFNRAAERITGFKAEQVIGKVCKEVFCKDVFGTEMCEENCPLKRALETGKPVSNYEINILNRDGRKLTINVSASLLRDESGEVIGGVESFRDVTRLRELNEELKGRYEFQGIIGKNHKMREIYELIGEVAQTKATVLIQGETGTGKDLIARAIHYSSSRRDRPFIKINCAALPESLLESELFGHVKGAFTGAYRNKMGRFELANGGTLFLDEIGELSPMIQAKLLRVLEEGEFERVGGTRTIKIDVRFIAATDRDLRKAVTDGTFREDLFYRLNVVSIFVPPLRERKEDIPLLVRYFMRKFNKEYDRDIVNISPDALGLMLDYDWPGNVRELEHAIEYAFIRCPANTILVQHLPPEIHRTVKTTDRLKDSLEQLEKQQILRALEKSNWNRGQAAEVLGIDRSTLWRKMKKYNLI